MQAPGSWRLGLLCVCALICASCSVGVDTVIPTPVDVSSLVETGQDALSRQDYAAAEASFNEAIERNPSNTDAHFGLGSVYVQTGRLPQAEASFKKVLSLDPNDAHAHSNLGVTYYKMENLGQAAQELEAALQALPDDASTCYLLAVVRLQQKNLPDAEQLLVKARDLDPELSEVYYGLGVLYKMQGKRQDAIDAFEKFLQVGSAQDPTAADHAREELKALQAQ